MSDPIESDDRILDSTKGSLLVPRWDPPAVTLQAAAGWRLTLGIVQDANSSTGCMIGGLSGSLRCALGLDRCLLLDGRIV